MPAPFTQARNGYALRDLWSRPPAERAQWFRTPRGGVVHRAVLLPHTIGEIVRGSDAGLVRRSRVGEVGLLIADPYLPLSPGSYRATFVLRTKSAGPRTAAAVLEVRAGASGRLVAAPVAVAGGTSGRFGRFTVDFVIPPGRARQRVECRLRTLGVAEIVAAQVEVEPLGARLGGA